MTLNQGTPEIQGPKAAGTTGPRRGATVQRDDDAYSPVIWDGTFPTAQSIITSHYVASTTRQDQHTEASKLNTMIFNQDQNVFNMLHSIPTACPMLVHLSGENNLRIIFGLAKYVGNPLAMEDNRLHGAYLAISSDPETPQEAPSAITLPTDVLKTNIVEVPSDADFVQMLTVKAGTMTNLKFDRSQWFKSSTATEMAILAKVAPLPLFLALADACTNRITASKLWERCKVHLETIGEDGDTLLICTIMTFCKAAHTKHAANNCVLPAHQLSLPLHRDAKKWAQAWSSAICLALHPDTPALSTANSSPATGPLQVGVGSNPTLLAKSLMSEFMDAFRPN